MRSPKQDCEALMNAVLPFAKDMLSRYRKLLPFGGTMAVSGEVTHVPGWTENERALSADVVALLKGGFRDGAALGKYRATALVYEVRVVPPGSTVKQDAIAINLDHQEGYSVVVMFPYALSPTQELLVSAPFASPGAAAIFHE